MCLEQNLLQSARACEGAAIALAHSLRHAASAPDASTTVLETFREAQAFSITIRAVLDEASPILPLLRQNANCVGKSHGLVIGRVKNGFDSMAVVLEALFDNSVDAILEVAGNSQRWLVTSLQKGGGFERMVTHHGQLRAIYGLLHLAAKIVGEADVSDTLFVNAGGNGGMDPGKWRTAINMTDFYGRYFGFHYQPEMRNILRAVNIARESVHKSHEEHGGNSLIKNVAMLGWGWVYSNMVLINTLGFGVEGVEQIGADEGTMSVAELRKFMNLVEEPIVAGVSGLASADVAVDRTFEIPPPGFHYGLEPATSAKHSPLLKQMLFTIQDPVRARLMSFRQRPLDLPKPKPRNQKKVPTDSPPPNVSTRESHQSLPKTPLLPNEPKGNTVHATDVSTGNLPNLAGTLGTKKRHTATLPTVTETLTEAAENSYLATTLKSELYKLHSNVSNFLGLEEAKPASGLILHFHGGGFVSQSSESHAVYMKEWCSEVADAVLLSIDYKLAPEYKFPVAVHECVYAYLWALQNAKRLGCKCERVVFAGDSAGGNLAVATALKVQELGMRNADGICVAYPALYVSVAWSPSRLLSFFDPLLPMTVLELCLKSYLPEGELDKGRSDPLLSPVIAGKEILAGLPKVVMMCGSFDPLLDDAVLFAERLKGAGRKGDLLRVFEHMPHGFLNLNLVNETAREGMRFMAKEIATCLGVGVRTNSMTRMKTKANAEYDKGD